jgi:hypothetical protein
VPENRSASDGQIEKFNSPFQMGDTKMLDDGGRVVGASVDPATAPRVERTSTAAPGDAPPARERISKI